MTSIPQLTRSSVKPAERTTTSILSDFLSDISVANSTPEGFLGLARAVETMGFGAIAYTAIPRTLTATGGVKPVFLASSSFNRAFLKHYDEAGLARYDFTIERICAGCMDVMDWHEEYGKRQLNAEQQAVVDVARFDYGIRSAVSIPTKSDEHVIAGASITCDETSERFSTLKRERLEMLKALVELFHHWVFSESERRGHFYATLLDQFTTDETRIIKLVVGGHRLKSSEDLCGISPTRAGNILSSLYRKLEISNAHELAYLVGVHQIARLL